MQEMCPLLSDDLLSASAFFTATLSFIFVGGKSMEGACTAGWVRVKFATPDIERFNRLYQIGSFLLQEYPHDSLLRTWLYKLFKLLIEKSYSRICLIINRHEQRNIIWDLKRLNDFSKTKRRKLSKLRIEHSFSLIVTGWQQIGKKSANLYL